MANAYTCTFLTGRLDYVYCPGLKDKVAYAQFLHDGSEVRQKDIEAWQAAHDLLPHSDKDLLALNLPANKPNTEIPVIELFLK